MWTIGWSLDVTSEQTCQLLDGEEKNKVWPIYIPYVRNIPLYKNKKN